MTPASQLRFSFYLFEKQSCRERHCEIDLPSADSFEAQVTSKGEVTSLEPLLGLPRGFRGQALGAIFHCLDKFVSREQEVEQPGFELVYLWNVSITSQSLTCYSTSPDPGTPYGNTGLSASC